MEQKNKVIRDALAQHNLPLWYLEMILGKSGSSITRMMRKELPEDEQKRIVKLIKAAAKEINS